MRPTTRLSPIVAQVRVREHPPAVCDVRRAVITAGIDDHEPVLAGHYPGNPVFPGVCVVECVRRGAELTAPGGLGGFEELESARMTEAVRPGDVLDIVLVWSRGDGCWRCEAWVRSAERAMARVRLRFADGSHR